MPPPRPSLLVLNQYYAPGHESTAQLLTDLCEALADDYDVTVVTGTVHDAPQPERTVLNGVAVVRVGSTAFDRSWLALRGFNYLSFVVLALVAALRRPTAGPRLCASPTRRSSPRSASSLAQPPCAAPRRDAGRLSRDRGGARPPRQPRPRRRARPARPVRPLARDPSGRDRRADAAAAGREGRPEGRDHRHSELD